MQSQRLPRAPGEQTAVSTARAQDEPLNDWALVGLLGGIYLGGLGGFVTMALAVNRLL